MLVYGFDAATGEFTGTIMSDRDPLGGGYIAPWNATPLAPPGAGEQEAAVFADGAWALVPDHRGETWYDGRVPVLIEVLGPPSEGLTPEPAPLTLDEQWTAVRVQRGARLAASDWTQVADAPLSSPAVVAWRAYRQALRDIPESFEDPSSIVWPEKP